MRKNYLWKSKGHTLLWLRENLVNSVVPKLITFKYIDWKNDEDYVLNEIKAQFKGKNLAIRSSSINEDSISYSNAGAFDSFLNIDVHNTKLVRDSINSVFDSYGKALSDNDELIIQEMVSNISVSGVIFTHEMKNRAPYYSINYDDISGSSTTVTSGSSRYSNKTLYIHRDSIGGVRSERFSKLLISILELENLFGSDELDIEFIITKKLEVYILQVRPIVFRVNLSESDYNAVSKSIINLRKGLKNQFFSGNLSNQNNPVFGQMPDWNPVEMIGVVPRNLAFSLYEKLITKEVWCLAREEMGYSKAKDRSLMHNFCGHPFINVESSFLTFIPSELNEKISEKLVKFWTTKLKEFPELHDKVEFDIAITTFSFDLQKKIKELPAELFSNQEKDKIKKAYIKHFCELMSSDHLGSLKMANKCISFLETNFNKNKTNIEELIEICQKYGTIPFAKLARHAFIGMTLLKSLHSLEIISSRRLSEYTASTKTILSEMIEDVQKLKNKSLKIDNFKQKYGHLRPGTYDIASKSYRDIDPIELFGDRKINLNNKVFKFNNSELKNINKLIYQYKLPFENGNVLLDYVTESIQARERSKFEFTKIIDLIFTKIKEISKIYSISIDDLSYLSIEKLTFIEKNIDSNYKKDLIKEVNNNKHRHMINSSIRLPQLIMDANHAVVIPFQVSSPNFITNKILEADVRYIENFDRKINLDDKIILIESADPGYDWLFTTKFKGLITKYGGANSHMAIRCAELRIPAAIGCGEELFEHLKKHKRVLLNCSSAIIQTI